MATATVGRQRQMGELGKRDDVRAAINQDHATALEAVSKAAGEVLTDTGLVIAGRSPDSAGTAAPRLSGWPGQARP